MSAQDEIDYYTKAYADDLAAGRDPCEFGMVWMQGQIRQWKKAKAQEETLENEP